MLITGISDVNDINDLRDFITLSIPETLHLVVGTPPAPRRTACRAASGQPERSPAGRLALGKFPGFSGTWHWPRGLFSVPDPACPECHSACPHCHIHQINIIFKVLYVSGVTLFQASLGASSIRRLDSDYDTESQPKKYALHGPIHSRG
jgi:hypothetical protein